jgi:hypothetical protein
MQSKQFHAILSFGEHKYDINKEVGGTTDLDHKISNDDIEECINILEYQYKKSQFPKYMLKILSTILKRKRPIYTTEKLNTLYEWRNDKMGIENMYVKKIHELFEMNQLRRFHLHEWKTKLIEFIEGRNIQDVRKFLKYGKGLLKESLDIHNIICSNPHTCGYDENFENQMIEIKRIEDVMASLIEQKTKEEDKKQQSEEISIDKIVWLGSQKQLAELFVELKKNGWIEKFEYETMKKCFTKTNTIQQVLKPSIDTSTGESAYEGIYTKLYEPKFYGIKQNNKANN